MKYEKPEVLVVAKAAEAIQGQKGHGQADSVPNQQRPSIAAYEADE